MQKNILIIEDDKMLSKQVSELLQSYNYKVDRCFDGESGLVASTKNYDLIILDIMLPERDGLSFLKILRKTKQTPVIIVSAKGAEEERIKGFYQGADDYLSKPFNSTELLLRIEALLRRSEIKTTSITNQIVFDDLMLNSKKSIAKVMDSPLELTPIQFNLLWQLLLNQGEVLSKAFLYQTVMNKTLGAHDRSIDMHFSRIRRKLNEAGWSGNRIKTSHGKGYCIQ